MQLTSEELSRVPREPSMLQARTEDVGDPAVDAVSSDHNASVQRHEEAQRKLAELKAALLAAKGAERSYAAGRGGAAPAGAVERLEQQVEEARRAMAPLQVERRRRYASWQRLVALHRHEIERRRWEECLVEAQQILAPVGAMIDSIRRLRMARAATNLQAIVDGRGHKLSGGGKAITVGILGRDLDAIQVLEDLAASVQAIAEEAATHTAPEAPQEPQGTRRRPGKIIFPERSTRAFTVEEGGRL